MRFFGSGLRCRKIGTLGAAVFTAAALSSCGSDSSSSDEDGTGGNGAASGGGSGDGAAGGLGGSGASPGGGTGGDGFNVGGGSGTAGDGGFEECVGEESQAEGQRLDMYVMQDHTNSMGNDCPLDLGASSPSGTSKWCYATHALARYFTSPSAAGHRAALQFMTVPDYVCSGGPDNGEANAAVPLTLLPVPESDALVTTLDDDDPTGGLGTQIEAALHGIATFTAANQTPGRTMIGVFITDGDPNDPCTDDIDALAAIAADHLAATGIRTFVIGMTGATLSNLEALAIAGGAPEHGPEFCGPGVDRCHYWSVGDGDPEAFVDALEQIQEAAVIRCEYVVPEPPPGDTLNRDLVNVTFTDPDDEETIVRRASDAAGCDAQEGGWYYDDTQDTPLIRLCPRTCDVVTAAGLGASLKLSYGCESVIIPE